MVGFWLFMLVMTLLIPAVMIGFGRRFWKRPPRSINWVFGYRTKRSMQNRDTWAFAHWHIGRQWCRMGWITLIPTVVAMLFAWGKPVSVVGTVGGVVVCIQMIPMIIPLVTTERALAKAFDDWGRPRGTDPCNDKSCEK